jgi:mannose-6-phosphate isomerase-like protein (cupin superfamily)
LCEGSLCQGTSKSLERFCGTSHWLAMPARLKFLTASPARLECFAEAPRNFAGRPEEDGRVFRGPERCPIEWRDVLQREVLGAVATLDAHSRTLASTLAPGAQHLVIYHFVVDGSARARLEDGPDVELSPGDIVVFPHGDPHHLSGGSGTNQVESAAVLLKIATRDISPMQAGGGGRRLGSCVGT